jgi:hypothetical protein
MGEVVSFEDFKAGKLTALKEQAVLSEVKIEAPMQLAVPNGMLTSTPKGDAFNYEMLMKRSMWMIMQCVLTEVLKNGVPQNSELWFGFDPRHSGVVISDAIKKEFPDNVMIMLVSQTWMKDLSVTSEGFEITLNLRETAEHMVIPFDSIWFFNDRAVNFGFNTNAKPKPENEPSPAA